MIKRFTSVVLVVGMLACAAQADTFDYTGSMDSSKWQLQTSGSYWNTCWKAGVVAKPDYRQFQMVYADVGGNAHPQRGAYVWTASEDDAITSISFSWTGNRGETLSPVVFAFNDAGEVLSADTTVAWTASAKSGSTTVAFDAGDNVKRVGLGFVNTHSYSGWYMRFSDAVITTVPEPMTLSLLGMGGLVLLRRRRR